MSAHSDGLERRTSTTRVMIDEEHPRRLRGNPIVFNSLSVVMRSFFGPFREIIHPEAVDRTLRSGDTVKAFWNHNSDLVLGSTKAGTLQLRKTSSALTLINDPPKWADPQIETIQRGDVDGMSFGFSIPDGGDEWEFETDDEIPLRHIHDMTFSEVSFVAFPAYPATEVVVSKRSIEMFQEKAKGRSIDFLRKLHKTNLARTFPRGVDHYEG